MSHIQLVSLFVEEGNSGLRIYVQLAVMEAPPHVVTMVRQQVPNPKWKKQHDSNVDHDLQDCKISVTFIARALVIDKRICPPPQYMQWPKKKLYVVSEKKPREDKVMIYLGTILS